MDSRCHLSGLFVLWSPLASGGQGSLDSKWGSLQGLPGRCVYARHLQRCGMVHAPNVREVLQPQQSSYFRALLFSHLSITRQGFVSMAAWASRSPSVSKSSSSSWKGTSQVTYVTMVPWKEWDTASQCHTSGILASACFIPRSWRRLRCICF